VLSTPNFSVSPAAFVAALPYRQYSACDSRASVVK
jgi:hypothetical protein